MFFDLMHIYRYVLYRYKIRVAIILFFSLWAQIFLLLSLLLPWQILQVLSTGHSRIDFIWYPDISPFAELIFLSIVIVTSFLLYLSLSNYNKTLIQRLATTIIDSLSKTKLMINQQLIATTTMTVIVRSISMIVNCGVFTLIGLLLYPKLMTAVIAYMAIIGTIIIMKYHQLEARGEIAKLQEKLQQNLLVFTNLGIATAFLVIIYDYLHQHLPQLFVIFMAVLVLRQALIAYINVYITLLGVIKRRQNINTLFLPPQNKLDFNDSNQFEQQFYQDTLQQWLPSWINLRVDKIISSVAPKQGERLSEQYQVTAVECIECKLTSRATIAYLVIKITIEQRPKNTANVLVSPVPSICERWLLLKCYHTSKQSHAKHERELLQACYKEDGVIHHYIDELKLYRSSALSSEDATDDANKLAMTHEKNRHLSQLLPYLYDYGSLPHGEYLLMSYSQESTWLNSAERKPYLSDIRAALCTEQLPEYLTERMLKTQTDLATIMDEIKWERLNYMTAIERAKYDLDGLINIWPDLKRSIVQLPKVLVLDSLITPRIAVCNGQLTIYDWQGWLYDSLGAKWTLSALIAEEVKQVVDILKISHISAIEAYIHQFGEQCLINHIVLAVKVDEFCRRLNVKNDMGAMSMIRGILITAKSMKILT